MGYSAIKIDGVSIKNPSDVKYEYYTITQSNRTADGDMVMDFIAAKRKFTFSYESIESSDMNTILELLWESQIDSRQCFHTLTYLDDGFYKTAIVYAGSIPKKLHSGHNMGHWVWKDVEFSLIEK